MRKRKVIKKVLPFALAVVLLLSMFALGASALAYEDYGLCDCIMERYFCVGTLDVTSANVVLECPVCGMDYEIESEFAEVPDSYDPFYCSDNLYYLEDASIYDDGGDGVYVGFNYFHPETHVEESIRGKVKSVNVLSSIVDSPSVVGNMTATITNALGGILLGVGGGIVQFFDNTVLDSNGNLTTFAIWALAFLGIAFALGVVKFITFLVKRK